MRESPSNWIKINVDLVTEVEKRGVKLKTKGKDKVGLCPFHDEKTPSFHITPAKKLWHCFGCDKGGSVIDFLKLSEGWDISEIMKQHKGKPMQQTTSETDPNPSDTQEKSEADILRVIDYYQKTLVNHVPAMDYLKQRGLQHPELVDTFRIGFSDRSLLKKLNSDGDKPDPMRDKLKSWGILRDSGQEHFRGCLTFPIFQQDGRLGEIYGRRISRHSSPHLYLPNAHQGVFNQACLGDSSPLILCESILDALTFWVHDFRHVTASFGANGFTEEMLEAFQSKGIETILIAYDNDKRGNEAADILSKRLIEQSFAVGRLMLPEGMDINDYALAQEQAKAGLQTLINGCQMQCSKNEITPKVNDLSILDPTSQAIIEPIIAYYHNTLKNKPIALKYLASRGLTHPDLLSHFNIGCASGASAKYLANRRTVEGIKQREQLKSLGLLKPSGHELFDGYITVPIKNEQNQISEIYGRRFNATDARDIPHLYLTESHQGFFNQQAISEHEPLILCESIIDAFSFWVHDFRSVTASFGTEGFTKAMQDGIEKKKVKEIIIAYDNDACGNQAVNKLIKPLLKQGYKVSRIMLPKNQDINEFMVSAEQPKTALQSLLDNRQFYGSPKPAIAEKTPKRPISALQYDGTETVILYGDNEYRIRGIERNRNLDQLKVQLRVKQGELYFLDTLDLASNRQRQLYIDASAKEIQQNPEIIKRQMGQLLLEVENLLIRLLSSDKLDENKLKTPVMSDVEQQEALAFLKQDHLFERIIKDFEIMGLVGEDTNKLVAYLAASSRKLEDPLALMIQSSSSAGKSTLMDAVMALMPPEDCQKWTAITEQALYYVGEDQLKNKILAVSEDEGAEKANYPLKNLITDKELRIATTIKDPKSGEFRVQERCVKGPTAIILTTTQANIDEELINRFLRLTIEESTEQTKKIHQRQREAETLQGLEAKLCQQKIQTKHHNIQRLLKPIQVVNPYAPQLTFISDYLRNRRDQKKYLSLIKTIAFIHQYQRPVKHGIIEGKAVDYIEVTLKDIELANAVISEVLGRCLDELAPQTRRLLELLFSIIKTLAEKQKIDPSKVRFTRREVRELTKWSDNQLKVHMTRLLDLEYLLSLQGGRGKSFVYELLWQGEGQDGHRFIPGLMDPKKLKHPDSSTAKVGG